MNRETFAVRQKELPSLAVISACLKGEVVCARAAERLCLSVQQMKGLRNTWLQRWKKKFRDQATAVHLVARKSNGDWRASWSWYCSKKSCHHGLDFLPKASRLFFLGVAFYKVYPS
jgi:hypothetical protein